MIYVIMACPKLHTKNCRIRHKLQHGNNGLRRFNQNLMRLSVNHAITKLKFTSYVHHMKKALNN